jgi:hypothetical protein
MTSEWPVADMLRTMDSAGGPDWSAVRGLIRQHHEVRAGGWSTVSEVLGDRLADALSAVSAGYHGRETLMCRHFLAILADVTGTEYVDLATARAHYRTDLVVAPRRESWSSRRRPTCYETCVETNRRRRDARRVRDSLHGVGGAGLLVGSTRYAPFTTVRGTCAGAPPSDLDLLVVVNEAARLPEIVDRLATIEGVSAADLESMRSRAYVFADKIDNGRRVFSHKLELWSDGTPDPTLPSAVAAPAYPLSLHVMTRPVLDRVLVAETARLRADTAGSCRTVEDYRETPRAGGDLVRTFGGRAYELPLETVPVAGGCLRRPRSYYFDAFGAYCPGFYQTMMLPAPELLWDDLDVRSGLEVFHSKLVERLRYEKSLRPDAVLRLSFAHVRRDVFTPDVTRLLDDPR